MWRFDRLFQTIDTHTGGNPTRAVLTGLPEAEPVTSGIMAETSCTLVVSITRVLNNDPTILSCTYISFSLMSPF